MKFCTEYGGKLEPGNKFSQSCGTNIELNAIKQEPPKPSDEIQDIPINHGAANSEIHDVIDQEPDESVIDTGAVSSIDTNEVRKV